MASSYHGPVLFDEVARQLVTKPADRLPAECSLETTLGPLVEIPDCAPSVIWNLSAKLEKPIYY